MQTFLRTT